MRVLNSIRVMTKDLIELERCHNSRARQLINKKEAKIITYNNDKFLKLNKSSDEILKDKDRL